MSPGAAPKVTARQIEPSDRDALIALLAPGFADRAEAYWVQAFARLAARRLQREPWLGDLADAELVLFGP